MKSGPIIIIEDDDDDKIFFEMAIQDMKVDNKLIWFNNAKDALDYFKTTTDQPFIIFSDVNLPKMSGIELKKEMDLNPYLRKKSIPFIFYSTSADKDIVTEAYTEMTIQGFFQKGHSYESIKTDLKIIFDYWKSCRHPNSI